MPTDDVSETGMRRREESWRLRPATEDDIEYVHRRWAGYFGGEGLWQTRDSHRNRITSERSDEDWWSTVLIAEADEQRIGCAVGEVYDAEWIAEERLGCPEKVRTDGRVGYLGFAAVAPPYRGRGIHGLMVQERVLAMAPHADRMYTISWVRDDYPGSTATFGGTWNIVDYVEEFYRKYSDRSYCPDCGGSCTCDAVIWVLDADKAEVEYGR